MDIPREKVRASVCYDWRNGGDLLIGHDGEWYLGVRECDNKKWTGCRCVSDVLDSLEQSRVRCMQENGQVDFHVRTEEARRSFASCLKELASEAYWERKRRNFGNAERYDKLVKRFTPLANSVRSQKWLEAYEIMNDVLARLEP
jgi:hypothetical protein